MLPNYGTIKELTSLFLEGVVTPYDFAVSQLEKLRKLNPLINAVVRIFPEETILKQAKESTLRYKNKKPLGPFDGITITIKDTFSSACKGVKLYKGSFICYLDKNNGYLGDIPNESVNEVKMLVSQGAIILCLTTVPELCWKGRTSSYLYGITRNPHNLLLTPGGSSGGAAALVALGISTIGIGSDGAGSVRIPSSCCGVIGFKPSYSLSCSKSKETFPYISHCGPICFNINDVILFMQQFVKYMNKGSNIDFSDEFIKHKNGVKGLNIAVSKDLDGIVDYVNPNVWNNTLKAVNYLQSCGANITFVSPKLSSTQINYYKCLCDLWCIAFKDYEEYINKFENGKYKKFVDRGMLEMFERNKKLYNIKTLLDIIKTKDEINILMKQFHKKYDILITPTMPILPPLALDYNNDTYFNNGKTHILDCYHSTFVYTCLFNLTHQPAITINSGYVNNKNGKIPTGLQIIGRNNSDNLVLKVAYNLDKKFKSIKISKL